MGNLCSRIFNSSQSWTTSQLVFGLVWPAVVVWFIMKVLVEKVYSGPHANALAEFKTQRANGFESFKQKSDPANPAVLDKIYPKGPRGTEVETVEMYHKILKLDFEKLRESLQNDEYRAITVMCAFVWRAMKINKELNCITQVITDAFDKAIKLDQEFYKTGKTKGPLHGLPFSVKSNFNVAGYPVTVGLAKLLGENKAATCPMVQFLCDLGAVPFCLTNVPQGLLSYITSNPIYGTTRNPWDLDRTPGGSSGGEAALLAAGGAAFGTGSDLAGSLRIPAAFCGLVTLKPTQDRLVTTGTHGGLPGRGRLGLSFGFYTHTVTDQHYLLDLIIGSPEYRRLCPMSSPARLQELPEKQKLRIGYFVDDGFHASVPSSRRAVEETIEKLKNQGHECVLFEMNKIEMQLKENGDWRVFGPNQFADMLFRNVMPDNGAYMANNIYKGETYDEHMKAFIRMIAAKQNLLIGGLIRALTLLTPLASKPLSVLAKARNAGLADMRQNQENTDYFKECWLRYWNGLGIDALVCPSFITPAQEFKYPTKLSTGAFLTGLFNMLDVPAGVVPVGYVSEKDIEDLQNSGIFEVNGDFLLKKQQKTCLGTEGLPTAVQVVTLPNEEEMCLRVMQLVEQSTKGVKKLQWSFDPAPGTEESGKEKSKRLFKRVSLFENEQL